MHSSVSDRRPPPLINNDLEQQHKMTHVNQIAIESLVHISCHISLSLFIYLLMYLYPCTFTILSWDKLITAWPMLPNCWAIISWFLSEYFHLCLFMILLWHSGKLISLSLLFFALMMISWDKLLRKQHFFICFVFKDRRRVDWYNFPTKIVSPHRQTT